MHANAPSVEGGIQILQESSEPSSTIIHLCSMIFTTAPGKLPSTSNELTEDSPGASKINRNKMGSILAGCS